jgi:4-amino-4-deoxy-L-arabinose transferase-like glycosyltransferase
MTGAWRSRAPILVPAGLAAVLRMAHYLSGALSDPLFLEPVVDARFHANQAKSILEEGWLLAGTGAYYKGPLYSYLLAPLLSVFGDDAGVAVGRLLSVVLGTLTVALVAALAGRLAGDRAAWLAGLAAAIYGTAIYFDTTLLLVPVVTLLLFLAGQRLSNASAVERPELLLAAAGALLGLVSLTRANGLLAVVVAAAWAFVLARRGAWEGLPAWRAAALVAMPALLVIAPVTARNAVLESDPVVVSWNGGINLFMGNDPAFDQGSGNWHPDLAWMRLYDAPDELGMSRGSEHQRFFLGQTWARTAEQPLTTLGVLAEKVGLLLTAYEIPNNRRIDPARERSPVLAVLMADAGFFAMPWSLFAPLIAAGLVLAAGRGWLSSSPLPWLAAAWALTPVLFFHTARYRLPAVLLLLPLAAAGWSLLFVERPSRRRALVAAIAAMAVLVVGGVTVPADPTLPLSDEIHLAARAERAGNDAEARRWLERAVAEDPRDPFARMRLGDHLRTRRRCEQALPHYRAVQGQAGLAADWHNAALRSEARCLAGLGRHDEAAVRYREFLARDPDRPVTDGRPDFHLRGVPPLVACEHRIELAVTLELGGRREAAVAELAKVIETCAEAEPIAADARRRLAEMAGEAGASR